MKAFAITAATVALSLVCFLAGYQISQSQHGAEDGRFVFLMGERHFIYRCDTRTGEIAKSYFGGEFKTSGTSRQ